MTSFPSPMKADTSPSVAEITEGQALPLVLKSDIDAVGPFRLGYDLSPAELEAAIEICELRECFYEQEGQTVLAEFMRESRAQLEAARQGVRT